MGNTENDNVNTASGEIASLSEQTEKKPEKNQNSYLKLRYYLVIENVLIALAFSLFIVFYFNCTSLGTVTIWAWLFLALGIGLLVCGLVIFFKIVKTLSRKDLPVYHNFLEDENVDPETGLYYYDVFASEVEDAMQISLINCYLASFQLEGFEHLRHFVGFQKATETMAEIGEVFRNNGAEMMGHRVICGSRSSHEFMLFISECDDVKEVRQFLNKIMNEINVILLRLPTAETFTAYCGFACYDTHARTFDELVKYTGFAVTEAGMFHKVEPHIFSPDAYKRQENEYLKDDKIRKILDHNELHYNFQPIVSAKTGKIFAYEALMRTKKEIGLEPTDVLELAARQDRLYEVEHYTFFNVIKIMQEHSETFEDRKLFLNSIPTVIIKEGEFDELIDQYGDLMKHLVIEITENGMQSEESCKAVHKYMKKSGCELALDDYGTGYSNVTTLLNNSPHYLKLDHSIIMGIDSDSKKQHLVSNYINFANNHNMMILAEGVETAEELQMVIQLGCHLIQGFYTGRPNADIQDSIAKSIEDEILAINLKLAKLAVESKVYEASNYDNISLIGLALDYYSQIHIKESAVRIVGDKNREVSMEIRVGDNVKTNLSIRDVKMRGRSNPVIWIGENSQVILNIEGDNHFYFEGIRVPKSAKLIIQGSGNLTVHVDHNNGIGIGCALSEPYGSILFEQEGTIRVESNSDTAIGIGGIFADENSEIKMSSGSFEILANGSKSVGIGSMEGYTKLILDRCRISIYASGADTVGIGSFGGKVDISSIADIELEVSGSNATGIGCLYDRDGSIAINDGMISLTNHCMNGVGIGSMNGNLDIQLYGEEVFVYAEGSEVGGIGNYRGAGNVYIRNGAILKVTLMAALPIALGGIKGRLEITGGNIYADLEGCPQPVNTYDTPVYHRVISDEDFYCKKIETEQGIYQYVANSSNRFDDLHIYLPKECKEMNLQL
ncbi:MAG: EAL domain-containing protein [Lachnospiraceae bacterium]|nr:EAL domain-containing protein [Lachnospiraceae bacterium]